MIELIRHDRAFNLLKSITAGEIAERAQWPIDIALAYDNDVWSYIYLEDSCRPDRFS